MQFMRLRLGLLTLVLLLFPATVAIAAPTFTGTLSAEASKYTWESSGDGAPDPGGLFGETLTRCAGVAWNCEYILLDVKAAGTLSLGIESTDGVDGPEDPTGILGSGPLVGLQDLDGYLYKSNAAGEPQGDALTNPDESGPSDCVSSHASEACKLPVQPGFYVLEVEYYMALQAPYVGTAELIGAAPAAAAPTPEPTPEPAAQPTPQPQSQPQSQPQPQAQPQAQPQPQPAAQQPVAKQPQKKPSAAAKQKACTKKAKKLKNKRKRAKALKGCKRIKG
jgi:hypothetical protein